MITGEGWSIIAATSALAALGFATGLLRPRALPLFAGAVLAGWAAVMIAAGAWYGACTGCTSHTSYDSARDIDFWMSVYWGGFFSVCIIAVSWLGAGVSALGRRLFRPGGRLSPQ